MMEFVMCMGGHLVAFGLGVAWTRRRRPAVMRPAVEVLEDAREPEFVEPEGEPEVPTLRVVDGGRAAS